MGKEAAAADKKATTKKVYKKTQPVRYSYSALFIFA